VHPALLPETHPLASVNDVFNGVLMHGDAVGDVMFYGRGAGGEPTASAVVADIVEVARDIKAGAVGRVSEPSSSTQTNAFQAVHRCGNALLRAYAGRSTGPACWRRSPRPSVKRRQPRLDRTKKSDGETAEIFWLTHRTSQRAMARSLNEFNRLDAVREVSSVLRVEGEQSQ
jgi:homoserine dehydrogenase